MSAFQTQDEGQFWPENNNLRGSITAGTADLQFNFFGFNRFAYVQLGGQLYSDTSPYGECSLFRPAVTGTRLQVAGKITCT